MAAGWVFRLFRQLWWWALELSSQTVAWIERQLRFLSKTKRPKQMNISANTQQDLGNNFGSEAILPELPTFLMYVFKRNEAAIHTSLITKAR